MKAQKKIALLKKKEKNYLKKDIIQKMKKNLNKFLKKEKLRKKIILKKVFFIMK